VKLKSYRAELQLAHKWTIARTAGTNVSTVVIVELEDTDGVIGRGEAAPTSRYGESPQTVEGFLGGVDPTQLSFGDVAGSMVYIEHLVPGNSSAKCALNLALLDGAAKRAGKPLYDFLGLGFRENHHITSFTIGIDTPEMIRKKVEAASAYPILKMKVGVAGDQENLAALRSVAPKKTVRVDANEGWKTREDALRMIEWLAKDPHIEYVEQPMPATTSVEDWAWLKKRSPLPIFGDESYHCASDITRAVDCFHGVNVKLVKTGGVSEGYEALKVARKAGLKTMIGCMIETSVLISAAASLAELCDHLDVDGNILITNDPFEGVGAAGGKLSFAKAPEKLGLRVSPRK
jgi:L-alanine-DL-glutamate epimerase-like enolase superfamily enzyme